MFTLCFVLYAHMNSNTPTAVECRKGVDAATVRDRIATCSNINAHDPLFTCETIRNKAYPGVWWIEMTDITGGSAL